MARFQEGDKGQEKVIQQQEEQVAEKETQHHHQNALETPAKKTRQAIDTLLGRSHHTHDSATDMQTGTCFEPAVTLLLARAFVRLVWRGGAPPTNSPAACHKTPPSPDAASAVIVAEMSASLPHTLGVHVSASLFLRVWRSALPEPETEVQ